MDLNEQEIEMHLIDYCWLILL